MFAGTCGSARKHQPRHSDSVCSDQNAEGRSSQTLRQIDRSRLPAIDLTHRVYRPTLSSKMADEASYKMRET